MAFISGFSPVPNIPGVPAQSGLPALDPSVIASDPSFIASIPGAQNFLAGAFSASQQIGSNFAAMIGPSFDPGFSFSPPISAFPTGSMAFQPAPASNMMFDPGTMGGATGMGGGGGTREAGEHHDRGRHKGHGHGHGHGGGGGKGGD